MLTERLHTEACCNHDTTQGQEELPKAAETTQARAFFLKSFQVSFLYWEYLQLDQIISEGMLMLTF